MHFEHIESIDTMDGFMSLLGELSVNVYRSAKDYFRLPLPHCRLFFSVGGVLFAVSTGGFQRAFESLQPNAALMVTVSEKFFGDEGLDRYATAIGEFFEFISRHGITRPTRVPCDLATERAAWEAVDVRVLDSGICLQRAMQDVERPFYKDAAWNEIQGALLRWGVRHKAELLLELSQVNGTSG